MEKKLTKAEYLEIKKQALLDRKACEKELTSADNIEIILDAYAESYEGEEQAIYRASFLMPSDTEFKDFYLANGKSTNACVEHYMGSELRDIVIKVTAVEKYGISDNLELETPETLEYDEEDEIGTSVSDSLADNIGDAISKSVQSALDKNRGMFSPLGHFDMKEIEIEERLEDKTVDRKSSKDNEVEKQTEEALEKINFLFKSNDTKDDTIKKQEEKISELEEKNETLQKEKTELEGQMDELNVKIIGLEEENRALREQYQRIIKAIDQKYGEYEETRGKRM